jgi:hypothetical protein
MAIANLIPARLSWFQKFAFALKCAVDGGKYYDRGTHLACWWGSH